MTAKLASILSALSVLTTSTAIAQAAGSPKHPEAEQAMAKIVLEKDFGKLKFHSREVVTMEKNDRVPGLNGLMFMRWKGDEPGTEVMASVQWFEKQDELLAFYAQSTERKEHNLGEFNGTPLWKIGKNGYLWTDSEHFLVSLGGSPPPPTKMVKAWLAMIASKVAEVEEPDRDEAAKQVARAWFTSLMRGETAVATSLSNVPFSVDGNREIKKLPDLKKLYDQVVRKKGKRDLQAAIAKIENSSSDKIVVFLSVEGDDEQIAITVKPGDAFRVVGFSD